VSGPAAAQHAAHHANSDSAAVATVIERIHAALTAGDSAAALALLAPHVMIADAGRIETRAEYRAHHLPGDIVFAQAVKSERKPVQVRVRGDVAWAIAATSLQGSYRDRAIDALGAELIVLTRAGDRWLITAIHWSSRQRHRRP
jgi:ketosteroid isomerase-like protein